MLTWIINWFCATKLWEWLVDKPLALLNFRLKGYTEFPIEKYYEIVDLINADKESSKLPSLYCFVSADKCTLGSFLIRKFTGAVYSHAGIIIPGTYKECTIKHMTSTGFHSDNMIELLKEVDLFSVIKYTFAAQQSYDLCMAKLGTIELNKPEYDEELSLINNKIYCSELVFTVLEKRIIINPQGECIQLRPRLSFGKEVFTPDHVFEDATAVLFKHNT
jgi:hypothetical protein